MDGCTGQGVMELNDVDKAEIEFEYSYGDVVTVRAVKVSDS